MSLNRHFPAWLAAIAATLALGSLAFVACGDDDDGGGGNGSDEDYVATLCGVFGDFDERFAELLVNADLSSTDDIEEFMQDAADIVGDIVEEFEDANPPADVEGAHRALLTAFRGFQETLEEGDFGELENAEEPDFDLPQDIEDRLNAVAANTEECQDVDLFEE